MVKIFGDSDDDFSDSGSVSNRRLSMNNVLKLDVEENDDTKEKRAKRKSILIDNGSNNLLLNNNHTDNNNNNNNNNKSNQQFAPPTGYTQEQIGNHYGNCIKLASENKINSKNAFNLHLIDYLGDYVKELKHFQTVGLSLDAGSKIYAGRVDSIFTNTYQVLTGLGNPTEEKQPNEEETATETVEPGNQLSDEDQPDEVKAKKIKRKINTIKNTICQNLRKIRINPMMIRNEVDPLFQSQAENFDDGGSCELRCNNLRLLDRSYELLLDSEKVISTNTNEDISLSNEMNELELFDLSGFRQTLDELRHCPVQFSELFEDFMFTGWREGNETMNSTTAESFRNMLLNNESKADDKEDTIIPNDTVVQNEPMDHDYDNYDDNDNFSNDYTNDDHEFLKENNDNDNKIDDEDYNIVTIGSSKTDSCVGNVLMSSVRDIVSSFVEHYGEMNDNMLGMWAGPQHWKQKAKFLKVVKTETDKKPNPVTKPQKEVKPIFIDKIETRLNEDGIGRMVLSDIFNIIKTDAPSTQLTDTCLNKNIHKHYLLPPRTIFSFKSINQLMNREVSLVNKVLKKHTDKIISTDLTDEEKTLTGDFKNTNDILEIYPPQSLVTDDDGNVAIHNNNDDDGGFANIDDDDYENYDGDAYGGNSFQDVDFENLNDQDPVTANVRRVEQIDIDYAKTAKRVNPKNLKAKMWSILQTSIKAEEMSKVTEKKYPNVHKSSNKLLFSDLLLSVDSQVTNEISKDLSVSILLNCLLHLTNETGLDISNSEDFSDLVIGQGYSEYDLEQISLFGKGNCLLNETRKRKSLDKSVEKEKKRVRLKSQSISDVINEDDLIEDDDMDF